MEGELQALNTQGEERISPPVLFTPKQNEPYTLRTDACDKHLGYALLKY